MKLKVLAAIVTVALTATACASSRDNDGGIVVPTSKVSTTQGVTTTTEPDLRPGNFLVGDDIAPGLYYFEPEGGTCFWERVSDATGSFDSIIANGVETARFYVEILDTDFMFSWECYKF